MTQFNLFKSGKSWLFALLIAVAFAVVGCSDFDETFGSELTPSSQDLALHTLDNNTSFSTFLYRSDSIRSSNIGTLVIGAEKAVAFGERRAGFFTQFTPTREFDEDDLDDDEDELTVDNAFGYMPIFDSLMFSFTLLEHSGDTTMVQQFEVYEALDVDFLNYTIDSVFFDDFDIANLNLSSEPIFTFTFPDPDKDIYVDASVSVRLYPPDPISDQTQSFIDRMLLMDDDADLDIYDEDERELFVDKFRGIYIKPVSEITEDPTDELEPKGALYSMYTDGSGMTIYARSRYKEDPTIIKDTVTMSYAFRNITSSTTDEDYYGISINTIERSSDLLDNLDTLSTVSTLRVEGLGGIVSKITIDPEIFAQIDSVLAVSEDNMGGHYSSIFVNQARLKFYLLEKASASYDKADISSLVITPWLDDMPTRLGLYSRYADYYADEDDYDDGITMLEGIEDYYYDYELDYGLVLPYNGYINRTFGLYDMTISAQFQAAWNSYLEAKEAAGGDASLINWDDVAERSFYLAPVANNLYTLQYASLQGMANAEDGGVNNAPIKLSLTYTLIKE